MVGAGGRLPWGALINLDSRNKKSKTEQQTVSLLCLHPLGLLSTGPATCQPWAHQLQGRQSHTLQRSQDGQAGSQGLWPPWGK